MTATFAPFDGPVAVFCTLRLEEEGEGEEEEEEEEEEDSPPMNDPIPNL